MEKELLKHKIIQRIENIDNEDALHVILSTLNSLENEQIDFKSLNEVLEKEDFNNYIKEWVKNM